MKEAGRTIAATVSEFSSQHLAVTLWGIAKLGHAPSKDILDVCAQRAVELMPEYNPQNIANTLWSFATLGRYPGEALLDAAAERAIYLMPASSHSTRCVVLLCCEGGADRVCRPAGCRTSTSRRCPTRCGLAPSSATIQATRS